ncbi:MAG TPA: ATP-binding cassette domain-containing protein, partial [Nitrosarchaeum sp.]
MSFNKLAEKLSPTHLFSNLSTISTKTLIQMNDVWASYDAKNYSLKEITLSIERGTNYAIVGQSGSGKSTLLKLINGMMIPSKGQIKVDYQTPNINNKEFKRAMSKIGYIPQSLGL